MKKLIGLVFLAVFVIGFYGNVFGYETYSYQSSVYRDTVSLSTKNLNNRVSHELTLPGPLSPAGYHLSSAYLVLTFGEEKNPFNLLKFARVFDGSSWSICAVKSGNVVIPVSSDGLIALNHQGKINFTLERLFGDYTFYSVKCIATEGATPAPLPGSVWLFGSVLLVLGIFSVKRLELRSFRDSQRIASGGKQQSFTS